MHLAHVVTILVGTCLARGAGSRPTGHGGTWKTLAPIASGVRQEQGTVAWGDKIYLIGGTEHDPANDSVIITVPHVDIYDTVTDTWSRGTDAPYAFNHPNVEAAHGKIYLLGGLVDRGTAWEADGRAAVYDPSCDTWTELQPMPKGTARGSACTVADGSTLYLVGGLTKLDLVTGTLGTVATAQTYNVRTRRWKTLPSLPEGRDHAGCAFVQGKYWHVGGRIGAIDHVRGTVFSFDPAHPTRWHAHRQMITPRGGLAAAPIGSKIYTFGGEGDPAPNTQGVFPYVEAYDVVTDRWASESNMPLPRHGTQARSIRSTIYIAGGGVRQGGFGESNANTAFTA